MKLGLPFLLLSLLATLLASCRSENPRSATPSGPGGGEGPAPTDSAPASLPPADRDAVTELAQGNDEFGLRLLSHLEPAHGNLIISPFSISAALGMTFAGAAGETREEMRRVLGFPADDRALAPGFRTLLSALEAGPLQGGFELAIANRLWPMRGVKLLPRFVDEVRTAYHSDLEPVDFRSDPEAARARINHWVEGKTHQRIRDLLGRGTIDADTRLVLTNAIYFKGRWDTPFDSSLTHLAPFHAGPTGGESISAHMMERTGRYQTAKGSGLRILELPYKGEALAMLILLPDANAGLPGLETRLRSTSLREWSAALQPRKVHVVLPRFSFSSFNALREPLAALGMSTAFDPKRADFSAMSGGRDFFVSEAVHKAFIEVNEQGTEAAAATGVVVGTTSIEIEPPEEFVVDHPFFFWIRHRATGATLFFGRVTNPNG